jgi:hypothetical protein
VQGRKEKGGAWFEKADGTGVWMNTTNALLREGMQRIAISNVDISTMSIFCPGQAVEVNVAKMNMVLFAAKREQANKRVSFVCPYRYMFI